MTEVPFWTTRWFRDKLPFIRMKFTLPCLSLVVLLGACGGSAGVKKPASDDEIRQKLPGTYLVKVDYADGGNKGTTSFTSDGGFHTELTLTRSNEIRDVTYKGYWGVQDGYLLTTITNTDNTQVRALVGHTNSLRIVSLDNRELVIESKSGMTYLRRK